MGQDDHPTTSVGGNGHHGFTHDGWASQQIQLPLDLLQGRHRQHVDAILQMRHQRRTLRDEHGLFGMRLPGVVEFGHGHAVVHQHHLHARQIQGFLSLGWHGEGGQYRQARPCVPPTNR
ncbi:MAG TPA: hypothetical protein DCX49_07390 [Flavobacteriales bacterium]|nr:hypothetical protein [Flavobacteriales bacterium]